MWGFAKKSPMWYFKGFRGWLVPRTDSPLQGDLQAGRVWLKRQWHAWHSVPCHYFQSCLVRCVSSFLFTDIHPLQGSDSETGNFEYSHYKDKLLRSALLYTLLWVSTFAQAKSKITILPNWEQRTLTGFVVHRWDIKEVKCICTWPCCWGSDSDPAAF